MQPRLLEDLSHQIIPEPPILTSKEAGWQNVFLAYYQHPGAEIFILGIAFPNLLKYKFIRVHLRLLLLFVLY